MSAKKLVEQFYKPDVFLNPELTASFLHDDVLLDWNSSKGFLQLKKDRIVEISEEMGRSYTRSNCKISHLVAEGSTVSVRFSQFVRPIENEREETLLAHFIAIWEVKDGKLYRGYQMSQLY